MPGTIEHLASFIHLLSHEHIPAQHLKLANIDNYDLQDRMLYKFHFLPKEYVDILALNLSYKIKHPVLKEKLMLICKNKVSEDLQAQIQYNIEHIK